MPQFNFLAILVATFSSFIVGMVYYHPKVLGTIWMKEAKITMDEKPAKSEMIKLFSLTFIFSFLVAFTLPVLTIHQFAASSLVAGVPADQIKPSFQAFMADYGEVFRTFKHGAFHGFIMTVFFVFPITAVNFLYEKKSWKHIFISSGYWAINLTLMGGIICAWK